MQVKEGINRDSSNLLRERWTTEDPTLQEFQLANFKLPGISGRWNCFDALSCGSTFPMLCPKMQSGYAKRKQPSGLPMAM